MHVICFAIEAEESIAKCHRAPAGVRSLTSAGSPLISARECDSFVCLGDDLHTKWRVQSQDARAEQSSFVKWRADTMATATLGYVRKARKNNAQPGERKTIVLVGT
jgi:hypothetical protein